jgi:hypothetical protein
MTPAAGFHCSSSWSYLRSYAFKPEMQARKDLRRLRAKSSKTRVRVSSHGTGAYKRASNAAHTGDISSSLYRPAWWIDLDLREPGLLGAQNRCRQSSSTGRNMKLMFPDQHTTADAVGTMSRGDHAWRQHDQEWAIDSSRNCFIELAAVCQQDRKDNDTFCIRFRLQIDQQRERHHHL